MGFFTPVKKSVIGQPTKLQSILIPIALQLLLGFPLRGDASPSGEAKEILVCQDPKKFQGGDADDDADDTDADVDGSTDRHEG